jgi:hypothetical protein
MTNFANKRTKMETRQITQHKIYVLCLNPMTGHTEDSHALAASYDKDKLIAFYKSEKMPEVYSEVGEPTFECHGASHEWSKSFAKGSVLEWYNPLFNDDFTPDSYGQGIKEYWVNEDNIERTIGSIKFIE